jgi:hypothetical protein
METPRADANRHLEHYAKRRQVAVGEAMEGRAAIYLDMRYCIILRDAQRGTRGLGEA